MPFGDMMRRLLAGRHVHTKVIRETIESKKSTIMFYSRGDDDENIIRNSTGQLARFGQALNKYPPVYMGEYDMDLYELLTKQQKTLITNEEYAAELVKTI